MAERTLKSESKDAGNNRVRVKAYNEYPENSVESNNINSLVLQRKAVCACGGGCPKCQSNNANLTVSQPHDASEIEADQIADTVMRMPITEPINPSSSENVVSRKCSKCEDEEEKLQRKESGNDSTSFAPPIVRDVLSSGGKPLNSDTRTFMESRFNYDFSNVKIHDNDLAAKSASSINALAYTSGNNIVFNSGQYNTNSESGKRLLAHELTHVVQQNNNDVSYLQRQPEPPKYYSYTTSDYVQQVIDTLNKPDPIAGVGDSAAAYSILNTLELPQLKDVLLQLGSYLDILKTYQSPPNINGVRTELYVKATRLFLMSGGFAVSDISEVIDHLVHFDRQQQIDLFKFMRQNVELDKAIKAIYSSKISYQDNTQLGGLIVGNFDFLFSGCSVYAHVRVRFDFASSIDKSKHAPFKKRFFDSIHNTWNKKYKLTSKDPNCPCTIIPININTVETTLLNEHKVVDVHDESDYREKVIDELNVNISSSDNTIAHEFGHVLGLYDEYDGGWLENKMFWHDTTHMADKKALMNEGTELRTRYFSHYWRAVQIVSPLDCHYKLEKV